MYRRYLIVAAMILAFAACDNHPARITELRHFPVENLDNVISTVNMDFDEDLSSDGNGAIKISVSETTTIKLYEIEEIDVENARLVYQARVKTQGLENIAYLEMLCHFPGKGEFFSRDLQSPLTGTVDWTIEETSFFLKKGEKPDLVRLNLVIEGKGRVWVDDVRLLKAPLK